MAKVNSKKGIRARATKERQEKEEEAQLFQIDAEGDNTVRNALLHEYATGGNEASSRLRKGTSFKKTLKSQEILAQRSSVPALLSRVPPATQKRRNLVDRATKERLMRIVHRDGKGEGLYGVKTDGSHDDVLIESARVENKYDVWGNKERELSEGEKLLTVHNPAPKAPPATLHRHQLLDQDIKLKSIPTPHPGTSYNPSVDEHQNLLAGVHEKYVVLDERDEKLRLFKEKVDQGVIRARGRDVWQMYEDEVGSGEEDASDIDEAELAQVMAMRRKLSKPKTKKQRRKEREQEEERRAKEQRKELNRLHNAAQAAKKLEKKLAERRELSLAEKAAERRKQKLRLAKQGLTSYRSGPVRVPDEPDNFQLGEELSENLRTLKPEGNLWKDWIVSEMKRGRLPVERANISKKGGGRGGRGRDKGSKMRSVEMYSFKNFKV